MSSLKITAEETVHGVLEAREGALFFFILAKFRGSGSRKSRNISRPWARGNGASSYRRPGRQRGTKYPFGG